MHVLELLEYELKCVSHFNGGVIVHPGNHIDRTSKDCMLLHKVLTRLQFPKNSNLLLENSAGQGTSLATTLDELEIIYNLVDVDKKKNIGFCIDTAHIFGYGEYDLSDSSRGRKII